MIAALAFSVACACPFTDVARHFTQDKPTDADLVGGYLPTASTLRFIRDEGGYEEVDTSIILSLDGSFEIVNMPDWWVGGWGVSGGGFHSGEGEWETAKVQDWWKLWLFFTSEDPPVGARSVDIAGDAPPYELWVCVGDPDDGNYMIFEPSVSD